MKDDKDLSKIMLGGNIFGHFSSFEETKAIFETARQLGIRAVDTADVYSNGVSESFIGEILKTDRSQWFIASKVGLFSNESPHGLGRKEVIFKKVEGSLQRLKTDYIDLYQMHHFDPMTPLEETIEAFENLIQTGKILSAGISNYTIEHLEKLKKKPKHCFHFHQIPLNLKLMTSMTPIIEESLSQRMALITYASLARGLFHEKYLEGHIPLNSRAAISKNVQTDLTADFLNRLNCSAALGKKYGFSLSQMALQWLKCQSGIDYVIVGCKTKNQLLSILDLFSKKAPESLIKELEQVWK